jgi:trehalose 6-phosphate phosphatase
VSGTGHAADSLPVPGADWAYFFDIDGTLVDFAPRPGAVKLDAELRDLIERLYRTAGNAVALISGRSIPDVDQMFPHARLPVAGQHGTERRDARGRVSQHAFPIGGLVLARARLTEAAARHPGLWLEDKGLSLALHYRGAPALAADAHRLMDQVLAEAGPVFCLLTGKGIVELKPAGRDKGVAVQEFMQEEPFRGRVPAFVGDDVTDEHGFTMVNRMGGYSVKVGPGETDARWRLRDVRAVRAWLARGLARKESA